MAELRQRRHDRSSAAEINSEEEDAKKKDLPEVSKNVGFAAAFAALFITRYFSASSNIVHDCDEVFNYWEPLHFLLYGSGFQTWEYSSEFALRSYLYILIHAVIGAPASYILAKVKVFYLIKLAFALVSAGVDGALVAAVSERFGKRMASYTLVLLCFASGCYTASTTFLPSTFSMYAISLASAAVLADKFEAAVAVAALGVLVGWPFSGLAVLPVVVYSLANGSSVKVFMAGVKSSVVLIALSALCDRLFYGQWKLSILNLVTYNVVGGGDSILYGVEGPLFYLRNGLNNFNLALLLAFGLPVLLLFVRRSTDKHLLLVISPLYLWFGFMSLQPHKEERFLYPIYPLICVAAAASIERIPGLVPRKMSFVHGLFTKLRPLLLSFILVASYSRTTSLLQGYSAPMQIYTHLPTNPTENSTVCIGSEWHRFPSSFFLPSAKYQVRWLDDGFRGLMPFPFDSRLGGTKAAPDYFNRHNNASPKQFLQSDASCDFVVELVLDRPGVEYRGNNQTKWTVVAKRLFLDNESSPRLHRAFFIPWAWQSKNSFGTYRLLIRNVVE
ncbi:dol-P-Man:Man(6)GlcNAc(2)-PP-Dol alpha-1,2-mannosyltransferase-like [Selaginella moellendorffii]|uniref:dol-P-Man:Man(6)GlcNAc(2)-PP-Dol alpha-1,2-mannosyltransferase-like n=1 Tax=Selaginella moellendorffii TaxID=88036 RepID=UPI000D1C733E|nr:dol-P-Man:Man(6)GlcNAc(2)-PP-Dol alpha-1,2-mannosyltransferase-like [Selaginella moellendorffii]|eukprot:XP_024534975.1 dol-P-Man:Man(6)GlcNAc(2)-PP-Dol alpha-1,2-mannosyltransferase-like [Selaginella moellendorffii]